MASFFQPAVYDPGALTSGGGQSDATTTGRFLVYTNSTLAGQGILSNWYQYVILCLGAAALGVPIFKWISMGAWRAGMRRRKKRRAKYAALEDEASGEDEILHAENEEAIVLSDISTAGGHTSSIRSFGLFVRGTAEDFLAQDYDLHLIDLDTCHKGIPGLRRLSTTATLDDDVPKSVRNTWILLREDDLQHTALAQTVEELKSVRSSQRLGGVVVSAGSVATPKLLDILDMLRRAEIPCMLLDEAQNPHDDVNLDLLCGVIYKNACILPNGERRDFFQAANLRRSMGRCQEALKRQPNFFIGFLDLWHTRPLSSVIRRAHKFAKFHGAIILHGPERQVDEQTQHLDSVDNAYGAFDWLKRVDVTAAQEFWINSKKPRFSADEKLLDSEDAAIIDLTIVEKVVPGLSDLFILEPIDMQPELLPEQDLNMYEPPSYIDRAPPRADFWTKSSQGDSMCELGCYDMREELFVEHHEAIVQTQNHLLKLGLLQPTTEKDLRQINNIISKSSSQLAISRGVLIGLSAGLMAKQINIFRGLDSGFCLPESRGHFWAVTDVDEDGVLNIFVSLKAPDLATTAIHAYLAHRGVPRRARMDVEMTLLETTLKKGELHPRLLAELEGSTYSELLHMLEQITVARAEDPILTQVKVECERLLIDEATHRSWVELHSHKFLAREVTIFDLLEVRLRHFAKQGATAVPQIYNLVDAFSRIDDAITAALYSNDESALSILSGPVWALTRSDSPTFSDMADLYALMFFCSLRRHAFEEVYMETTDRCPLFLQQRDQAAVFAELWVLGSQCEKYFGIKPKALGGIIYDEYRNYLHLSPPPVESWTGTEVFTAYHKVKAEDLDTAIVIGSEVKSGSNGQATAAMPFRARLAKASFLTIFCVPAIVDVGLLTFLGRGLYLTAFMTLEERVMANYAVLAGLIMTAGITGWSGSTGGFYLYQSAFHNMNHFMVQRLAGGFMLACLLAICGFIAFGIEYSWYAGFIFVAYLMVLSTYLNLLGIMATMHRDGAPFKSGRTALAQCLLITLISPFLTSFVNGHDVLIYLLILYLFLAALLISYSRLCNEWSSWPERIPIVKEAEILQWYRDSQHSDTMQDIEDASVLGAAIDEKDAPPNELQLATAKLEAMLKSKNPLKRFASDEFFKKIAIGHPYVLWLLNKEANGQPLPPPYSSTWLVQTKLALTNQQQLGRGLKEHSPFLLFRLAKYDLAQNVGLFLIALLDRWVAVSMSANGVVVNVYYNERARYGIAFGLLYFLLCAVSLDVVLQRYWGKTGRRSSERLQNIFDFEATESSESAVEKRRWFMAIMELSWIMTFWFGLMTIFVWLFVVDGVQVILYLAYIVGYSGVIVFQFNRVFTTDIRVHVHIVFAAAFGGYVLGVVLHEIPGTQDFRFNDVIALCAASIGAAVGTWLYTDFCDDASQDIHIENEDMVNWKVYSQKLLGETTKSCTLSASRLQKLQGIEARFADNSVLSTGIKDVFAKALLKHNAPIHSTFARAQEMLEYTMKLWSHNQLRLFVVDRKNLTDVGGGSVFAASAKLDDTLMVYIGMPSITSWRSITYSTYETLLIQLASEAMLHECCEAMMNLRHSDATLAELLLNANSDISTRMAVQLAWAQEADLAMIKANTNPEILRHLALGIDVDVDWIHTPEDVRIAAVSRVVGKHYAKSDVLRQWLVQRADSVQLHDWYIRQALAIMDLANSRLSAATGQKDAYIQEANWTNPAPSRAQHGLDKFEYWSTRLYEWGFTFIELVAIISTAGTDAGRELWYLMRGNKLQAPAIWCLLKVWKLCWWVRNFFVRRILLRWNSDYQRFHEWTVKGASRTLAQGILKISDPRYEKTGFVASAMSGVELAIYNGTHEEFPEEYKEYQLANYDSKMRLKQISTYKAGDLTAQQNVEYSYSSSDKSKLGKYPVSRKSRINGDDYVVYYNENGRITHGDCMLSGVRYRFQYEYRKIPHEVTRVMKATYTSIGLMDPVTHAVFWCKSGDHSDADVQSWIPTSRVAKYVKTTKASMEETTFSYEHKRDPVITRTTYSRAGHLITSMEVVQKFNDELNLTKAPEYTAFEDEDLLFYHSKQAIRHAANTSPRARKDTIVFLTPYNNFKTSVWWRVIGKKKYVDRSLISTAQLRSTLWKRWANRTDLNAVTTCLLDEEMLREEPTLHRYWSYRDAGFFAKAKDFLTYNINEVVAAVELTDDASAKMSLVIKPSDLFVMGTAKDSNFVTNQPEDSYIDTEDRVGVIFTDTGCWPDAPGGVSNCRRDLVDGHTTIRNYALTESANEYGIPRFQVEKNLQMVKNLPLWGLDGKSPCHGLFDNLLQTQVEKRIRRTRLEEDIEQTFIPLLTAIVRGARTRILSKRDLAEFTKVFLNLNRYFEENDYLTTWRSKSVRKAWREAWLTEYADENISNPNDSFEIERPTASDFDEALELYISYFFIFSIRVPDQVPRVYQSTHHGISSLFGMILKIRRGTTWGVSPAQSFRSGLVLTLPDMGSCNHVERIMSQH